MSNPFPLFLNYPAAIRSVLNLLSSQMKSTSLPRFYQTSKHFLTITKRAMSSSERPTGLIAKSGIELLTFGTPNGHKASILLEELKEAYGKDYVFQSINIMENIQKEPWFTKHSPNGRVSETHTAKPKIRTNKTHRSPLSSITTGTAFPSSRD